MNRILLDTNVVLRLLEDEDPEHSLVRGAVGRCVAAGRSPCLVPQVLVEFWVVATRPRDVNGFGWEPQAAREGVDGLVALFPVLPDAPEVFSVWLEVVTAGLVRGKRAHDVRLAVSARMHGVTEILTLNPGDYAGIGGIAAVHPSQIG